MSYINAILKLKPTAQVAIVGDDTYENIDWGNETPIDKETLDSLIPTPIEEAKQKAKKAINSQRDAAELSGFSYLGKQFDSDPRSIMRLYGAALAAQAALLSNAVLPKDKFVTWTCADNTTVDITYEEAIAIPLAMAQVSNMLHIKARTLKDQINSAKDTIEVGAVKW